MSELPDDVTHKFGPSYPMVGHFNSFERPVRKRMSAEEIGEFAEWLKVNEPFWSSAKDQRDDAHWELFAYRIVQKLGL